MHVSFLIPVLTVNINELLYCKKGNIGNGCNQYSLLSPATQSLAHTHKITKAHVRGRVKRRCGIRPMPMSRMLWMLIPSDLFDPLSPQLLCVRHFQHHAGQLGRDEFKRSR